MDQNEWRVLWLVVSFVAFLAIAWWVLTPKRKKRFEQDARSILDDSAPPSHEDKDSRREQ
jgi:cytochrome c oxidase cbb3-type subunit 4